ISSFTQFGNRKLVYYCFLFFFFQAEDGIRDRNVTGVQTCALPILRIYMTPRITVQTLINIAVVILGSFLFSIGINTFMIAGNLGEGGVTGVAIILLYAFDISPAISTLVLNSLLLIVGFKYLS